MGRIKQALEVEGNLRLHKIASNCDEVIKSFPSENLAKHIKGLNLGEGVLPLQRS